MTQVRRFVDLNDWHVRVQPVEGLDDDVEQRMMATVLEALKPYEQAGQLVVEICVEVDHCNHPEHQPVSLN